ncbi:MAG TPA: hypothetical protein PK098_10385 [Phycisphaerales bacterium]|nr:hypothetical protein [Phycisphaerales bacterium]
MMHAGETICIALTPPGAAVDALRAVATERGWRVVPFDEPLEAMAELAVRERAQAARSAWGLPRVDQVVMTVVEPSQCEAFHDLNGALAKYFPSVERYVFMDKRLTAVAAAAETNGSARRGLPTLPKRELTPRSAGAEAMTPPATSDMEPVSSTVTREELEILLGRVEDER